MSSLLWLPKKTPLRQFVKSPRRGLALAILTSRETAKEKYMHLEFDKDHPPVIKSMGGALKLLARLIKAESTMNETVALAALYRFLKGAGKGSA